VLAVHWTIISLPLNTKAKGEAFIATSGWVLLTWEAMMLSVDDWEWGKATELLMEGGEELEVRSARG
jgi:hypothetical protein